MALLDSLREKWKEAMGWDDEITNVVDVVLSCYLTPWLPGNQNPCWCLASGPAGCGKSTILNVLRYVKPRGRTVPLDDMTEKALTSHYRDEKTGKTNFGILDRISRDVEPKGPKVLLCSEFSTVMTTRRDSLSKQLAIFRQSFDGHCATHGGMDGERNREFGRFGFLAAGTESSEEFLATNQVFGERTIKYRWFRKPPTYTERKALANRVMKAQPVDFERCMNEIQQMTSHLLGAASGFLNSLSAKGWQTCNRTPGIEASVKDLGNLATLIRSGPGSQEVPSRLPLQLRAFGDAHTCLSGRQSWDDTELRLIRRIAQDSPAVRAIRLLVAVFRGDQSAAVNWIKPELARLQAKLPPSQREWTESQLQHWALLGLMESKNDSYRIPLHVAQDIQETQFLEGYT